MTRIISTNSVSLSSRAKPAQRAERGDPITNRTSLLTRLFLDYARNYNPSTKLGIIASPAELDAQ